MSDDPLRMHPFESAIIRTLEADNARLTAENEKLRAALEDLLRLVENEDGESEDAPPYLVDRVFDAARAALSPPAPEPRT